MRKGLPSRKFKDSGMKALEIFREIFTAAARASDNQKWLLLCSQSD
jgi:hypothetical protein